MYKKDPDPWKFASSEYELNRYKQIYNALNYKYYDLILEPACSIGVLTEQLSTLANSVKAFDISSRAVSLATKRCAHLSNVSISCNSIEDYSIERNADLIILSEIGYYFDSKRWRKIVTHLIEKSPKSTIFLASHWLGYSQDHNISGDEVHLIIHSINELSFEYGERNANFRIDRWKKK
ncbi:MULTISPECIES: SAM-dependent methyltransferase [Legionella]|nr:MULTISPECIES: SAM-dependent methyltransferase [Legionella]